MSAGVVLGLIGATSLALCARTGQRAAGSASAPTSAVVRRSPAVAALAGPVKTSHAPSAVPTSPRPSPAAPSTFPAELARRIAAALTVASDHRLQSAIAVLDTRTGAMHTGGAATSHFATASVAKLLIVAELLVTGQMHGPTADLARTMITRSDDGAADVLWGRAGADDLEPRIAARYGIADLGAPNVIPGFWGSTQVTASGFARAMAALRHDPRVWPWLQQALSDSLRTASDGTDQLFGLRAADPHALVKQGWSTRSANHPHDSVIDTVGFVDHARYVVVLLTEGHAGAGTDQHTGFNATQAALVTAMARALLD